MSPSTRSKRSASNPPRKPRPRTCVTLTPFEISHLLESSVAFVRTHTLYAMALGAGLSARQLNALDISDVAPHDATVVGTATSHRAVRGVRKLPALDAVPGVRRALARYLVWRRARCGHF